MTRINTIPVSELSRQHLLAEHREIKRIPNTIKSGKAVIKNIPAEFTLGTGHVKFFYDKIGFLKKRYKEIHAQCLHRNYDMEDYSESFEGIDKYLMNDWTPTEESKRLIRQRIVENNIKSDIKKQKKKMLKVKICIEIV